MADEYSRPPYNRKMPILKAYVWPTLTNKSGAELELHYNRSLRELGREKGILGQIFTKSQNKIQDPAKLYKLTTLINAKSWVLMVSRTRAIFTKACSKKMQKIPRASPVNILHPGH